MPFMMNYILWLVTEGKLYSYAYMHATSILKTQFGSKLTTADKSLCKKRIDSSLQKDASPEIMTCFTKCSVLIPARPSSGEKHSELAKPRVQTERHRVA